MRQEASIVTVRSRAAARLWDIYELCVRRGDFIKRKKFFALEIVLILLFILIFSGILKKI